VGVGPVHGLVGGWVVYDALRRGFFLAVKGPHGRQKLRFSRRAERPEIEALLHRAEQLFGYAVERET